MTNEVHKTRPTQRAKSPASRPVRIIGLLFASPKLDEKPAAALRHQFNVFRMRLFLAAD